MPILLSWQPEIGWEEKRLWRKVRRTEPFTRQKTETWRHFPGVKNEEMRRTERFTRLKLPWKTWRHFPGGEKFGREEGTIHSTETSLADLVGIWGLAGFVRLRFLGGVLGQGYTWALLMGLLWLPIIGNHRHYSLQLINSIQF